MNVNFEFNEAEKKDPIRIEQVFAEKPAGGMISNPSYDAPATTAVGVNSDGDFVLIKGYRLVEDITAESTSIKIEKGSGIERGDVIGYGSKSVASTAVDKTNEGYDVVTVTMGVVIKAGEVLYQSASASVDAAAPKYTPIYVTGNDIEGGKGDVAVRLINGANLRKETAMIGKDIAALMPTIALV